MEFDILFDTQPIPIIIISVSERNIVYANRAAVLSLNFPSSSTYEALYTYQSDAIDTLIKLSDRTGIVNNVSVEDRDFNGDKFLATVNANVMRPHNKKFLLCMFSLKPIDLENELHFLERAELARQLVNEIGQSTYHMSNVDENIQYILGVAGSFADVSRAYIVEYNGKLMSCTYEWHANDDILAIRPSIYDLPINSCNFDYEFMHSGIYYTNDTEYLSDSDKIFMLKNRIRAAIYIPFFENNKTVGYLAFEVVDTPRKWDDFHISAFQNIANIVATIIYRKNAEQKLNYYAKYDILTGIYNRRWGERLLTEMLVSEVRASFILCFIDMDKLKYINDNFGHDSGDFAIKRIVSTINRYLSADDIFSRYGGDEFLLMLPKKSLEYVEYLFQNVIAELDILSRNLEYPLSISYGYIETDTYTKLSMSELIFEVDERMYKQKMAKRVART